MAVIYDWKEAGDFTPATAQVDPVKGYQAILEKNRVSLPPMLQTQDYVAAYSSWAFACASLISVSMAAIDLKMFYGRDQVDEHPLLSMLARPNPLMTGVEFTELTALYLELAGEAFWLFERTPLKVPVEAWPVLPWNVELVPDKSTGLLKSYKIRGAAGSTIEVPPEDVLHYKQLNPLNPWRGISTIQAAAVAIDTDRYAAKFGMRFFENSAIPAGVLETQGWIDDDTRTELEDRWAKGHKGVDRAYRMAVLQQGLTYKPLGISQKDAEFLELRRYNRDEIMAIFGIPKAAVGLVEDVNRANAETGEYVLTKHIVKPRLKKIEARLNQFLVPQYDARLKVTFDDPVPDDEERRVRKTDVMLMRGVYTINEVRAEEGRAPLPGCDVPLIPLNYVPYDGSLAEAEPAPKAAPQEKVHKALKPAAQYAAQQYRVLIPKFRKRLKGLFKTQGQKVIAALEDQKAYQLVLSRAYEAMGAPDAWVDERTLAEQVVKIAAEPLIEIVEGDAEYIANAIMPQFKNAYSAGVSAASAVYDLAIDFDLSNPTAIRALDRLTNKFAKDITETTVKEIRAQIAEAMQNGEGIPEITARLKDVYTKAQSWRAEIAARTETAGAYSQGSLDSWRASGVVGGKSWSWTGDEEDCPSGVCGENEAAGVIALGDTFPSGDDGPPAHPNCICCLIPERIGE